jgi:hypothetical protein
MGRRKSLSGIYRSDLMFARMVRVILLSIESIPDNVDGGHLVVGYNDIVQIERRFRLRGQSAEKGLN